MKFTQIPLLIASSLSILKPRIFSHRNTTLTTVDKREGQIKWFSKLHLQLCFQKQKSFAELSHLFYEMTLSWDMR